jgi:hypothetical protein
MGMEFKFNLLLVCRSSTDSLKAMRRSTGEMVVLTGSEASDAERDRNSAKIERFLRFLCSLRHPNILRSFPIPEFTDPCEWHVRLGQEYAAAGHLESIVQSEGAVLTEVRESASLLLFFPPGEN